MSDISEQTLITISCYFLFIISQCVVARHSFGQNGTNSSKQFQEPESDLLNQILNDNLTILDYYFFSYDVIDHRTLLVKFDIKHTI